MLSPLLFRNLIYSKRAGALIRRIAWLSTGAIFVSVTAFLLVLFVMRGMNRSIENRVVALEPHLIAETVDPAQASALLGNPVYRRLQADPDAQLVLFESQEVILRSLDGLFHATVARGLDASGISDFLREINSLRERVVTDATTLPPREETLDEGEAMVGLDLARTLNLFEGDQVTVMAPESLLLPVGEAPRIERLTVKKIISTNLADLDAQLFIYPRGKGLRALGRSATTKRAGFEVRWPEAGRAEVFKSSLTAEEMRGLKIETWGERNRDLFFALRLEKLVIGAFLGLAGLIAGSSILTVMALLLTQKRRDIALLRVIGLSARATVQVFARLGFTLALVGIVGGLVAGTAIGFWVQHHPLTVLPDIYYDAQIPAEVDLWLIVGTAVIATGLAFLGAWFPSRSLAKMDLAQLLRAKQ